MKAFIDADIVNKVTGHNAALTFYTVERYVIATGNNELYCAPKDYFDIAHNLKNAEYHITHGIIDDGLSFFSVFGIRFIMIPPDKVDKYKLLK